MVFNSQGSQSGGVERFVARWTKNLNLPTVAVADQSSTRAVMQPNASQRVPVPIESKRNGVRPLTQRSGLVVGTITAPFTRRAGGFMGAICRYFLSRPETKAVGPPQKAA